MKYLNDRITVTVSTVATENTGMYKYEVINREENTTIFVGNFFHTQGNSSYTFDITDIVRSDVKPITYDKFNWYDSELNQNISSYRVTVTMNNQTYFAVTDYVLKSYLYPNYNATTSPDDIVFEFDDDTENLILLFQSNRKNVTGSYYDSLPIFPCYADGAEWANSEFPFFAIAQCGADVDEVCLCGNARNTTTSFNLCDMYGYTGGQQNINFYGRLKDVCNAPQVNNITAAEFYVSPTDFVEPDEGDILGVANICYNKRYFLVWQDRLGSMMSKPFSDYTEFTESFEKEEVKDYTEARKLNNVQVQPKWKITSGWLNEKLYPIYESIYISPVLFLYDMKYNKCYNVMVNGDYTEKTYRNQKKLINITLELEQNNKQNILY